MFCPKCGSILTNKSGKPTLSCKCGYESNKKVSINEIKRKPEFVSNEPEEIHPLATYTHECSKCGFNRAQLISKGIWYTDEDEVHEYVCGKCGNHDRAEGHKVK